MALNEGAGEGREKMTVAVDGGPVDTRQCSAVTETCRTSSTEDAVSRLGPDISIEVSLESLLCGASADRAIAGQFGTP